ncbi:hypothetical protein Taro_001361 [Colocasia esculenta]|uniref:Uncharacterized protein n=1 Tax=Colocasia esculenta TaxID=4460 RepID=A0A843TFP4_COLES|nr:hypothetical protein [Colocasia esculenta]
MPTFGRFPLLGLELKEREREPERDFFPRNSLLLGLSSWSNKSWGTTGSSTMWESMDRGDIRRP